MKTILLTLLIAITFVFTGCFKKIEGTLSEDGGIVIEVDQDGNEVWRTYNYENPVYYSRDDKGNQYVADAKSALFSIYDKDGALKLQFSGISPQSITVTPEHNILMVNKGGSDSLVETDQNGEVVRKLSSFPGINHAVKLNNGNYLIASEKRNALMEINPKGQVVWKTPKNLFNNPVEFYVTSTGTYLIADFNNHRVLEIDKNLTPGWDYQDDLNHPQAVVRLEVGKHLIADYDNARILVVNYDKKITKEIPNIKAVSIAVLPNGNAAIAGQLKK